jgi:hypothetical protein
MIHPPHGREQIVAMLMIKVALCVAESRKAITARAADEIIDGLTGPTDIHRMPIGATGSAG